MMENSPILAVVVPCYKEEAVLHETHKRLSQLFDRLIQARQISPESYILYVNDGRDRKSTRLNSSHNRESRMPSSA